jgi:hypothetical protein
MWTTAPKNLSLIDSAKHRITEAKDQVTLWTRMAEQHPALVEIAQSELKVWRRRLMDAQDDLHGLRRQRTKAALAA